MPTKPGARVVPLFRDGSDEEIPEIGVSYTAGLHAPDHLTTSALTPVDLAGRVPAWFFIGAGASGKTVEARWLAWRMAGLNRDAELVALDPANRSLASWFENVLQPPTRDGASTARWLIRLLESRMRAEAKAPMLLDFGGGDVALSTAVESAPGLHEAMEQAGFGVVACYALTPRVDDLGMLDAMERAGFQPKATLLLLNEGRADPTLPRSESFASTVRHSVFRNAVARGAIPVWMPALESDVMQEIDAKRLDFTMARDGSVPDGARFHPIGGLRRCMVGRWLQRMETAHEALASKNWLP